MEQRDNSKNHQDEVSRRCNVFVKKFVQLFEEKLTKFYDEVLQRIKKHNKSSAIIGASVGLLFRPFGLKSVDGKIFEDVVEWAGRNDHMKKAKRIIYVFHQTDIQTNLREELVDRGLEIFSCLERQFMNVEEDDGWQVVIEKLAQDSVNRVFNYIDKNKKNGSLEENFYECISNGVLHGESKGVVGLWFSNIPKYNSNTISKLYENTGLVITKDGIKYYNKKGQTVMKNGYRLLFNCEQKDENTLAKILSQYVEGKVTKEEYTYVLLNEKKILDLREKILDDINKQDFGLQLNKLSKEIEVIQINKHLSDDTLKYLTSIETILEKQDACLNDIKKSLLKHNTVSIDKPLWFEVRESLNIFTGRTIELKKLDNTIKEGIVVINGLSGVGKSELILRYITPLYSQGYSVIWVNAVTTQSLAKSFHRLCKQIGYNMMDDDGEEMGIKTIVNDIYNLFNDGKSVFVLDNAENLEVIIQFLPLNLPPENRPIILITSTSCNWMYNMRVQVVEIFLDNFNENEAISFFKTYLNITDNSQDEYIKEFVLKLNCFPLALQQVAAYIYKEETNLRHVFPERSVEIFDYLKEYEIKAEEILTSKAFQNMDGAYEKSTFTALKIHLEKLRNTNQNGEIALQVLNVASYFAPENIPCLAFKMLTENSDKRLGEIIGLLKQNAIFRQDKMLNLHSMVQLVLRTELREKIDDGTSLEVVTLRKALDILKGKLGTQEEVIEYATHIVSVWKYAVQYKELIDDYIIRNIQQNDFYSTFFHVLAERGTYEIISEIIDYIWDKHRNDVETLISMKDTSRSKAIHNAAINGNEDIIELLIRAGANVNVKKKYNWTPLHLAAKNGHLSACKVLLDNKANIDAKTSYKFTPLHLAIKNHHLEVVTFLLFKGADVNAKTKHNFTPLHFAIINNGWEMINALLEDGHIDIGAETTFKKNGLHLAATRGDERVIRALLDRGVNPHAVDTFGMTPLQIALDISNYPIADVLKKFIANSNSNESSTDINPSLTPSSSSDGNTSSAFIHSDMSDNSASTPAPTLNSASIEANPSSTDIILDSDAIKANPSTPDSILDSAAIETNPSTPDPTLN